MTLQVFLLKSYRFYTRIAVPALISRCASPIIQDWSVDFIATAFSIISEPGLRARDAELVP